METQETAPSLNHATFLRIALEALSLRFARWMTLLGAFALFGAAVWSPDWKRIVAAAGFTVLVYLPMLFKREK